MLKTNNLLRHFFRLTSFATLSVLLLGFSGCATQKTVKVPNVYVSYETREDVLGAAVNFGPKKVKRLEIEPDHFMLYFEDNRGQFVPIDKRLKWFKWSDTQD